MRFVNVVNGPLAGEKKRRVWALGSSWFWVLRPPFYGGAEGCPLQGGHAEGRSGFWSTSNPTLVSINKTRWLCPNQIHNKCCIIPLR